MLPYHSTINSQRLVAISVTALALYLLPGNRLINPSTHETAGITTKSATATIKPEPQKTTLTDKSDNPYALALSPEQVNRINQLKLPPQTTTKTGLSTTAQLPPPTDLQRKDPDTTRCTYNQQTYSQGDMVKTASGWLRCTPTLTFATGNTAPEKDKSAWTTVQ